MRMQCCFCRLARFSFTCYDAGLAHSRSRLLETFFAGVATHPAHDRQRAHTSSNIESGDLPAPPVKQIDDAFLVNTAAVCA
jgi:hypothetical protein